MQDLCDELWLTKRLNWNIKYFLSCWVNSTRITRCLCLLKARTKHTDPSLKNRKPALSFSWRTVWALHQLEWLRLCCCLEKSHVRTALGQVLTLSSKLGFGLGPLHCSSVSLPACVQRCELHTSLHLGHLPSVPSALWLPTVQTGGRASVGGGLGLYHKNIHMQYDLGGPFCDCSALWRSDLVKILF